MNENITLVDDWDFQPKLGDSKIGHHVLREKENSILLDFLTRRNEGSLLVCGQRGTGKTSSIFGAINQALSIRPTLIPILIKATSIQFDTSNRKESLLKHLIDSLHKTIKDDKQISNDLRSNVEKLYENSIASEKHNIQASTNEQTVEKTTNTKLNLVLPIILLISSLAFLFSELIPHSWILSLIAAAIGGTLVFDYQKKKLEHSSTSSSTYIKQEYNFSTLISEFEELLTDTKKHHTILFILDEFDKIQNNPLEIITDLKMLINQSNALFMFITVPTILGEIEDKNSPNHTLFSQKLFLQRPLFVEMRQFIDNITDTINDEISDTEQYENFKNYLCYISRTNFFELYSMIRDYIKSDKKIKQTLNFTLDRNQITKANLQKCIAWVYDNKKRKNQSEWQLNDEMLESLYGIILIMEDSPKSHNFTIDKNMNIDFGHTTMNLSKRHEHSAVMDLFPFLVKQGYLRKVNDTTYTIIGDLSKFHTDVSGIFVEEQRVFVSEYEKFRRNIINFANIKTRWVENLGTPFSVDNFEAKWQEIQEKISPYFDINTYNDARTIFNQLQSSSPPLIPTETLQEQLNNLRSVSELLYRHSLLLLSEILSKQLKMNISNNIGDISQGLFSTLKLPNQNMPNTTLQFQDNNKKIDSIAIALSPQLDLLSQILQGNFPNNHIVFYLGDSDQYYNYQNNINIISAPTPFQTEIRGLSYLKEDEKNTIFYTLELPLESDKIKKILPILKKIPSKQ